MKDYTVRLTDIDGSFTVLARNLDLALQLQGVRARDAEGMPSAVANSMDDSSYRVEKLTPGQFYFATGQLSYTANVERNADGSLRSAGSDNTVAPVAVAA